MVDSNSEEEWEATLLGRQIMLLFPGEQEEAVEKRFNIYEKALQKGFETLVGLETVPAAEVVKVFKPTLSFGDVVKVFSRQEDLKRMANTTEHRGSDFDLESTDSYDLSRWWTIVKPVVTVRGVGALKEAKLPEAIRGIVKEAESDGWDVVLLEKTLNQFYSLEVDTPLKILSDISSGTLLFAPHHEERLGAFYLRFKKKVFSSIGPIDRNQWTTLGPLFIATFIKAAFAKQDTPVTLALVLEQSHDTLADVFESKVSALKTRVLYPMGAPQSPFKKPKAKTGKAKSKAKSKAKAGGNKQTPSRCVNCYATHLGAGLSIAEASKRSVGHSMFQCPNKCLRCGKAHPKEKCLGGNHCIRCLAVGHKHLYNKGACLDGRTGAFTIGEVGLPTKSAQ